ncbi:Gx transporter family protein [Lachnospiraceae bacterium JLR.KK008]
MRSHSEKTAALGVLLAFALILGYVETLIPFSFGVPGMKLGLANLAVVLTLYLSGVKEAFWIDILRIVLSGFLFGSMYSLLYSLAGGMLSFAAMAFAKKTGGFGVCGVSMAGGVFHNIGQLAVAAFVVETKGIFYYLPPLLVSGTVTGMLTGIISGQTLRRIRR